MAFLTFAMLMGVSARMAYGVPLQSESLKPFIVGGVDAPIAYAPHMAALIFGERVQFISCGGSIISRRLILTAAHCIEPFVLEGGGLLASFHALVGSNKWNSGGTTAKLKDFHIHPQWDSTNIKNDVGILTLKDMVELSDRVGIIKLAYDFVKGNVRSFVTGWGATGPRIDENSINLQPTPDDLQLLYVSTISYEQCQKQMTEMGIDRVPPIQEDVEICTFHSVQHGMCNGDSGSALVRISTNEQIGIVSWGISCARGAPDVFARILRDFIEPIMNKYKD